MEVLVFGHAGPPGPRLSMHVWNHSKHDWPDWLPMAAAYLP
jgi:hypothetical protein